MLASAVSKGDVRAQAPRVATSEQTRRLAFAAATDAEAQREIAESRRRWGTADLERSADLLRGIGEGRLDVRDPAVRTACAEEENHLRQLLLLSPAAFRMSAWFARALANTRSAGIRLVIRSGDQDAPDQTSAGIIGGLVLDAVAGSPAGSDVTVGWFPAAGGTRLIIVRPTAGAPPAGLDPDLPASWSAQRSVVGDREVVEIAVA